MVHLHGVTGVRLLCPQFTCFGSESGVLSLLDSEVPAAAPRLLGRSLALFQWPPPASPLGMGGVSWLPPPVWSSQLLLPFPALGSGSGVLLGAEGEPTGSQTPPHIPCSPGDGRQLWAQPQPGTRRWQVDPAVVLFTRHVVGQGGHGLDPKQCFVGCGHFWLWQWTMCPRLWE